MHRNKTPFGSFVCSSFMTSRFPSETSPVLPAKSLPRAQQLGDRYQTWHDDVIRRSPAGASTQMVDCWASIGQCLSTGWCYIGFRSPKQAEDHLPRARRSILDIALVKAKNGTKNFQNFAPNEASKPRNQFISPLASTNHVLTTHCWQQEMKVDVDAPVPSSLARNYSTWPKSNNGLSRPTPRADDLFCLLSCLDKFGKPKPSDVPGLLERRTRSLEVNQ